MQCRPSLACAALMTSTTRHAHYNATVSWCLLVMYAMDLQYMYTGSQVIPGQIPNRHGSSWNCVTGMKAVRSQVQHFPAPEHRTAALAQQAATLYLTLYFAPAVLHRDAGLVRTLVDR